MKIPPSLEEGLFRMAKTIRGRRCARGSRQAKWKRDVSSPPKVRLFDRGGEAGMAGTVRKAPKTMRCCCKRAMLFSNIWTTETLRILFLFINHTDQSVLSNFNRSNYK